MPIVFSYDNKRIYIQRQDYKKSAHQQEKLACYLGPEVIERQHVRSKRELNCVNVRPWGLTVGKQPGRGPNRPWVCIFKPTIRGKTYNVHTLWLH